MPARAIPVITALWWGPTQAWAGRAYEIPGQRFHWLSSGTPAWTRSEEHTSELQSHSDIVCRLLLEKKNVRKGIHLLPLPTASPERQPAERLWPLLYEGWD